MLLVDIVQGWKSLFDLFVLAIVICIQYVFQFFQYAFYMYLIFS